MRLWQFLTLLRRDRRGVTALEYGIIGLMILVVIVAAVTTLGRTSLQNWQAGVTAYR